MNPKMSIAGRKIGGGCPVYFIAEAGSNHDGRLEQALALVDVAADAGADAVKFQVFRADHLYPRQSGQAAYLGINRSIHDIARDLELPWEWIPQLAHRCHERGIHFLATPFDEESADRIDPFVPAFKIASYELTHFPLIQHCARKGRPLIVSTGASNLEEVREALAAIRAVSDVPVTLMQCTAAYPAPLETLRLRSMIRLALEFGTLVGLSDHSREPLVGPMAAVALGASMIEKHFTLANSLKGPDHRYALEPHELRNVVTHVRAVERSLGRPEKAPCAEEEELRSFARRSVFTTRCVDVGERLRRENSAVLRAGTLPHGIHPRDFVRSMGRKVIRKLTEGMAVGEQDLLPLRLRDGRVSLRLVEVDDADRILEWRSRPDVMAFLFSATPPDPASHLAFLEGLALRSDRLEFMILDGKEPVGTAGLSNIDLGVGTAELGILIGEPSARRQGIAFRAADLLRSHGYEALGLRRIDLEAFADNTRALRLYERLGFVPVMEPPTDRRGRAVMRMTHVAHTTEREEAQP